jgi:uncharacterized protein (TIGR03437 family)
MRTLLVGVLVCGASIAQTVRLQRVVSGLAQPTDIQSPVDGTGRLFILEQAGRIRIVKNGSLLEAPFLDIRNRVGCCGERGLLGLAFPPRFAEKHYFYVNYTDMSGDTVVSRFRVPGTSDTADPGSEQVLLRIDQPFSNHNGGALVFGPDGFLYIGMGDGGSGGDPQNNGQRTDTLLGKMLRIDTESGGSPYGIPPSNPFVNRSGFRPEIWATGLRNPWRYAFDRETRDLWIADVGQNRAEEVNFQPGSSTGGENYGWNRMEGLQCYPAGSNCDRNGLTMPVLEYPRSAGCSVTGGKVYRGRRWPELQGAFLYADYCTGNLWAVRRGSEPQLLLAGARQSFSSFGEGENGELYIADQGSGSISLITAGGPALTAAGVVNAASFAAGISPGSLATMFGTGITSFGGVVAPSGFPLPTELAGTNVTINGIAAPLIGIASTGGQEQINIQVPYQLAGQTTATVVVTLNGQAGSPVQVPIVPAQPEMFAISQGPGRSLTIYATGLGMVSNPPTLGTAALAEPLSRVESQVEVRMSGASVPVSFAGLAPGFAGLYQINAQAPDTIAAGDVEITVTVGGATSRAVRFTLR